MPVTLHVDLPLPSTDTPTLQLRGPWPTEGAITGSPFTLAGSGTSPGRFTCNAGDLAAGLYRGTVHLSGLHIATFYCAVTATSTDVRMVDDPDAALTPSSFASSIAQAVATEMTTILLSRFVLTQNTQAPQIATLDVSRAERLALGPRYVGAIGAYNKADMKLIIGAAVSAPDVTGRLVFIAKPTLTGADGTAVIKVDSVAGLQVPSGAPIVAGDGTIAAIPNGSNPSRSVDLKVYARAMNNIAAQRLYWDLKRYVTGPPAQADVLATGILDLSLPLNQAIA